MPSSSSTNANMSAMSAMSAALKGPSANAWNSSGMQAHATGSNPVFQQQHSQQSAAAQAQGRKHPRADLEDSHVDGDDGANGNATSAAARRSKKPKRTLNRAGGESEGPLGIEEEMQLGRAVEGGTWLRAIASDRGSSVCIAAQISQLMEPKDVDGELEMKVS